MDHERTEERIVTVYEPHPGRWSPDLRRRATLMRCERCDNGERLPACRARLAERDGHTAVVLDVPVEQCSACGEIWLTMDVAKRLDALFNQLLASGAESAQIHWNQPEAA
ncbi:MAG: YgiT-type zinc finger protein [Egibacteraceae bacterium]